MGHENGGKQRLAKRRYVQGMLDETDPLKQTSRNSEYSLFDNFKKPPALVQILSILI